MIVLNTWLKFAYNTAQILCMNDVIGIDMIYSEFLYFRIDQI